MFKGVSQYIPIVSALYFCLVNPFYCSRLPLTSHPHFSTAFNILISSAFADVMFDDMVEHLSFHW
jgi:hypothetical protein